MWRLCHDCSNDLQCNDRLYDNGKPTQHSLLLFVAVEHDCIEAPLSRIWRALLANVLSRVQGVALSKPFVADKPLYFKSLCCTTHNLFHAKRRVMSCG
jgi:hypothetical protein